jgi:hypothetical protein
LDIVFAVLELDQPGGIQTYALTVAPQLERLGHHVALSAQRTGAMADLARARGLRVCGAESELPAHADAVISNDAATALVMADLYPDAIRGLVLHGAEFDLVLPPPHEAVVQFAVAMNGVVQRRAEAHALAPPVTRLRQPIDTAHFYPAGPVREQPQRLLMLGNYLRGRHREQITGVCADRGIAAAEIGAQAEYRLDPMPALIEADIVVGSGRVALEAMACGRAVWLFGHCGADGWIDRDSYPAVEDDGLRSRARPTSLTSGAFADGLDRYTPILGEEGRALVVRHHSPYDHAIALVALLERAEPARPAPAPLRELARLVRTQYDSQVRVGLVADELRDLHAGHQRLSAEHARLRGELAAERERARRLEAELAYASQQWRSVVGTRRWRAASAAAKPFDRARAHLGRT